MKKILIIYEQIDTTVNVNIAGLRDVLKGEDVRYSLSKQVTSNDLQWCDICLAIRPNSIYTLAIAKSVIDSGRFFVSLFDDDLLNLPEGHSFQWRSKYAKSILELSQYVICCNPSLISTFKDVSSRPKYVLSNAHILEEDILPIQPVGTSVKVVYAAGKDHADLFNSYILPAIDSLYNLFEGKVEFWLIGVVPDISKIEYKECIKMIDTMPLEEYNQFMRENRFDIGVAPLHDNQFCNKKYFNKYIEYTKCGIDGLYSNCLPYTLVVKNKFNGVLVNNTKEDWYNALVYAIKNMEETKAMAKRAQEHIEKDFTLTAAKSNYYKELDCLSAEKKDYKEVVYKKSSYKSFVFEINVAWHRFLSHYKSEGLYKTIVDALTLLFR
jgi:hypothetical protein